MCFSSVPFVSIKKDVKICALKPEMQVKEHCGPRGGGQNLERRNVERPKDVLYDSSIKHLKYLIIFTIVKY